MSHLFSLRGEFFYPLDYIKKKYYEYDYKQELRSMTKGDLNFDQKMYSYLLFDTHWIELPQVEKIYKNKKKNMKNERDAIIKNIDVYKFNCYIYYKWLVKDFFNSPIKHI